MIQLRNRDLVRLLARRLTEAGLVAVVDAATWDIHVDPPEETKALGDLLRTVESFLQGERAHSATVRVDGRSYVFDPAPDD